MSFASLPIEIIIHIFDLLDESDVELPLEIDDKHRKMCKALMALRLTCKELGNIATPQLFRTLYVSPPRVSWFNAHRLVADQKLRVHLQTLAFDYNAYGASYGHKFQDTFNSPRPGCLDISLFPNLKVLRLGDTLIIRRKNRSSAQIPLGCCGISLKPYGNLRESFEEIERYGFSLASLNVEPGYALWWRIKSADLSDLKYLRLNFERAHWNKFSLDADLGHLTQLPSLEEFHMDQFFFPGRSDGSQLLDEMTNVLRILANVRNWPRLRHLDLRYLITTVEDLKAFVAPHAAAGTLKTVEIHGDLVCAQSTEDEKQKRVELPHWFKTVICPDGGGVTFKQVFGLTEELYVCDYWPRSPEGSLSDAEELYESEYLQGSAEGSLSDAEDSQGSTEGSVRDAEDTEEYSSGNGLPEEENPQEQG